MKIMTIMCNTNEDFYEENVQIRKTLQNSDIQLSIVNIDEGPESLESSYDEAIASNAILRRVVEANVENYDAVVIDCAADPVYRAAREISDIPVVSAGEASYHTAMMLGSKFSVIAVLTTSASLIRENIEKYGFHQRLASVRSAEVPVLELGNDVFALEKIRRTAEEAISKDGADVIVLGCTGMIALRDELQLKLKVPVVEPYTASVFYAADLVRMNLTQSRAAFEKPNLLKKINSLT